MFTIKQASLRTGVPVATLRAWERRYAVVAPQRTESRYRLYDAEAIADISAMRGLVEDGWSPSAAAVEVSSGRAQAVRRGAEPEVAGPADLRGHPDGEVLTEQFLRAASAVDAVQVDSVLEQAFALGSFETVTETWLMPTLRALGDAWADGTVDVAGEHTASHAVMRRLSQAFAAAGSVAHGPRLVVGLPPGSHHELGALAFATAARRRGLAVVYVGADLPAGSWVRAVRAFPTRAAVIAVPTSSDRDAAATTARALASAHQGVVVAAGGAHGDDLAADVLTLPPSIAEAAAVLDDAGP